MLIIKNARKLVALMLLTAMLASFGLPPLALAQDVPPTNEEEAPPVPGEGEAEAEPEALVAEGTVSGVVWQDSNANGQREDGEPLLEGVTVIRYVKSGPNYNHNGQTTTDSDGSYSFTDMVDGNVYYLSFKLPVGDFYFTRPHNFGDDLTDSDVEPFVGFSLGSSDVFVFNAGDPNVTTYQKVRVAPGGFATDGDGNPIVTGTTNALAIDAGIITSASISGKVWQDLNKDGQRQTFEPGRSNVKVNLYRIRGEGETQPAGTSTSAGTTTTDSEGNYTFPKLPTGQYYVSVPKASLPASCDTYTAKNAADDTVDSDVEAINGRNLGATELYTLGTSQALTNVDAGLLCDNILGSAWVDSNGDALRDLAEPALADAIVTLYIQNNSGAFVVSSQTTTDSEGNYYFVDLIPGKIYIVSFASPEGTNYLFTRPQNFGDDDTRDSDAEPFVGYTLGSSDAFRFVADALEFATYEKVRVAPGGLVTDGDGNPVVIGTIDALNIDAGFAQPASVSGTVWQDLNKDGEHQAFEPGKEGVKVNLYRIRGENERPGAPAGSSVNAGSLTTDADGNYTFTDLPVGQYYVSVPSNELPENCPLYTAQDAADDAVDSDVEDVNGPSFGATDLFNVASNQTVTNVDAGLICNNVAGRAWLDANGNAIQDAEETGLEGIRVQLYRRNDAGNFSFSLETTTDSDGNYYFLDLTPGALYYLSFKDLSNTYLFTNPANFGDDDTADSDVEPFVGFSLGSSDVFAFNPANVETTKYYKVTVAPGGVVTDDDGNPVVAGTTNQGALDAGFVVPASVSGKVWQDLNKNGTREDFEPGMADVEVNLYRIRGEGETQPAGTSVNVGSTTTDGEGNYIFEDLAGGEYYVSVPQNKLPENCANFTAKDAADDAIDSDVEAINGGNRGATEVFNVVTNQATVNVDAGLLCNNVAGLVWMDTNGNGTREEGENGVEGIRVQLYRQNDAGNFSFSLETTTDASGNYFFSGLQDGRVYYLSFKDLSDTLLFTHPENFGDNDTLDSDVEPFIGYSLGSSDAFVFNVATVNTDKFQKVRVAPGGLVTDDDGNPVVAGTTNQGSLDAGFAQPATISGRVWHDVSATGVENDGEPGLEGVTVRLYRLATSGQLFPVGTSVNTGNQQTDENGNYSFTGLPAGEYFVSVPRTFSGAANFPANCTDYTALNVGPDDALDSDVDPEVGSSEGSTIIFPVTAGATVANNNAGLICSDEVAVNPEEPDTDNGGGTGDTDNEGNENTDNDTDEENTDNDTENQPPAANQPAPNGGGGGGGGGGGSLARLFANNNFTGQSLEPVSKEPCLQIFPDRALTFTDGTSDYAELLKTTAMIDLGYNEDRQFVISGYGNTTNETGTALVGLNNALTRLEAVKIVTTALLCYQIKTASSLSADFTFGDLPRVYPENQWYADLAYTAYELKLISGRDNTNAELARPITKQEFVTLIVRAYEAKYGEIAVDESEVKADYVNANEWYYPYYLKAEALGVLTDALRSTGQPFLRRDAFMAIVHAATVLGAYEPDSAALVRQKFALDNATKNAS